MNRRSFLGSPTAACLVGMSLPVTAWSLENEKGHQLQEGKVNTDLKEQIDLMPNFCSHEHWGSIDAIGSAPQQNGFRADVVAGATPQRIVSVWDLLLDPYAALGMQNADRSIQSFMKGKNYPDIHAFWKATPRAVVANSKNLSSRWC